MAPRHVTNVVSSFAKLDFHHPPLLALVANSLAQTLPRHALVEATKNLQSHMLNGATTKLPGVVPQQATLQLGLDADCT